MTACMWNKGAANGRGWRRPPGLCPYPHDTQSMCSREIGDEKMAWGEGQASVSTEELYAQLEETPEPQRQVPGSFSMLAVVDGIVARGLFVVMSAKRG